MPTSRQQILAYIRKHQTASATDISRAMQMTPANAHHHLAHLEANGLIEVTGQWRGEGRGRPVQVYGLSRHALGDNLDNLADALLCEWLANLPLKKQEEHLRAIAKRLAQTGETSQTSPTSSTGLTGQIPITRRLALAMERLNELHYQARWEAGAAGPRIILGHCPHAGIIEKHPELCRMEGFLLEERLGLAVEQIAKLEGGAPGLTYCLFEVRQGAFVHQVDDFAKFLG